MSDPDVLTEPQRPESSAAVATRPPTAWLHPRSWWVVVRRHPAFTAVFVAGVVLRVITMIAYRPALLFIDSFRYLDLLKDLDPTRSQPIGYDALVLRPILSFGNLMTVVAVQHLAGLAIGVAIYALLLRYRVWPWLAALATVPMLLDAYQLQIEQNIMSETLFEVLLVAGVVILLWNRRPGNRALVLAGVLLGTSLTVRLVGGPVVIPAAAFVLAASPRGWWRLGRAAIFVAAFAVPVVAYAGYYYSFAGEVRLTSTDGNDLYGRAATIVDCNHLSLPADLRQLCPPEPLGHRRGVDEYAHHRDTVVAVPPGKTLNDLLRAFTRQVFIHQPLDLAHAVGVDFLKGFRWDHTDARGDVPVFRWQFQTSYPRWPGLDADRALHDHGGGKPTVNKPLAHFLRAYQMNVAFVPGPFIALGFAVGLLAGVGVGRARRSGLRAVCLLPATAGLVVLLGADFFEFSWRYQLPALSLAPLAGALGVAVLCGRARPPGEIEQEEIPSSAAGVPAPES